MSRRTASQSRLFYTSIETIFPTLTVNLLTVLVFIIDILSLGCSPEKNILCSSPWGYISQSCGTNYRCRSVRFVSSSNFYSLARLWRAGWQLTPDRSDPRSGLFIPDLIHPIHDFDPLHGAPAGYEGARECCIREADREGIIPYASCARWGRGPPISPTLASNHAFI